MWQQTKIAVARSCSQTAAMFTRLLLKLARTFFKETRCSCKTFAEYCQVSAKDTRYRHATAYNTEKDSSSKIRRATQTQKPCYSITQCIRAAFANIFVANISAPSFWKRFAKFFGRENFATYGIWYDKHIVAYHYTT